MKTVSVIGSTGSIGKTALSVIKRLGYKVCALTANSNLDLLKKQADEFEPEVVGVIDTSLWAQATELFGKKLVMGMDALTLPCALSGADIVLVAVVGLNGIFPVLESIRNNKIIALANKESLVAGGELVNRMISIGGKSTIPDSSPGGRNFIDTDIQTGSQKVMADVSADAKKIRTGCQNIQTDADSKIPANSGEYGKENSRENSRAKIIPVDSEHSAVFQCLKSGKTEEIEKIILTASGGAFYNYTSERLRAITPADIFHPNWIMGRKITLDSCTMMNKALEIIEAYWLFGTDKIDYVVHPESIIHAMVSFKDGSTVAQLAVPDMSLPIQYALCYPDRNSGINSFAFDRPLTFLSKNNLFYAPELAHQVIKIGGTAGAVFNAAGEAAAELFENGKILFTNIVKIVEKCLFMSDIVPINSIDDLLNAHNSTKDRVNSDYKLLQC